MDRLVKLLPWSPKGWFVLRTIACGVVGGGVGYSWLLFDDKPTIITSVAVSLVCLFIGGGISFVFCRIERRVEKYRLARWMGLR